MNAIFIISGIESDHQCYLPTVSDTSKKQGREQVSQTVSQTKILGHMSQNLELSLMELEANKQPGIGPISNIDYG